MYLNYLSFDNFLEARPEVRDIFRGFFWKKKCFWEFLTFSVVDNPVSSLHTLDTQELVITQCPVCLTTLIYEKSSILGWLTWQLHSRFEQTIKIFPFFNWHSLKPQKTFFNVKKRFRWFLTLALLNVNRPVTSSIHNRCIYSTQK